MANRRWLDRVRGDINENGLSMRELGVRPSGTNMKRNDVVTGDDDVP